MADLNRGGANPGGDGHGHQTDTPIRAVRSAWVVHLSLRPRAAEPVMVTVTASGPQRAPDRDESRVTGLGVGVRPRMRVRLECLLGTGSLLERPLGRSPAAVDM
jgi:hypothetical protein